MVATHSRTSKGKLATGASCLPVPVYNPGSNLMDELFVTLLIATEQSSGEPIRSIVGFFDRGFEIFNANHVEQRPEKFFVASIRDISDVDQARRYERVTVPV